MFIYVVQKKKLKSIASDFAARHKDEEHSNEFNESIAAVFRTPFNLTIEMETIDWIRNYLLAMAMQIGLTISISCIPDPKSNTKHCKKRLKWRGWAGVGSNLYMPHALSTNDKKKEKQIHRKCNRNHEREWNCWNVMKNEIRIHFHVLMKWNAWFVNVNTWRLASNKS